MPYSKLFRSRWSALFWAGGIIWTAVDVADASSPPPENAVDVSNIQDPNVALFANVMNAK